MTGKRLNGGNATEDLFHLRVHDLIAKTADLRLKDTLRVLLALRIVAEEYDLDPAVILTMPYSTQRPTPDEKRQCEAAYAWMYDNDELSRSLYEIEQLV